MSKYLNVLLATHNGEDFLEEQIESILSQTFTKFTLMIRDDCSTDSTTNILNFYRNRYPNKIKIHWNKNKPEGPLRNFSKLISLSETPYTMLSDQDDIWLPHKIESSIAKIQHLETKYGLATPLLVHSDLKVVESNLDLIAESFFGYAGLNPKNTSLNRLLIQNVITGCTIIFNRLLAKLSTPIPPEAMMHDWWLALIASAKGEIATIDQPTVLYRQHGANALGAKKWSLNFTNLLTKAARFVFSKEGRAHQIQYRQQASVLYKTIQKDMPKKSKQLLEIFLDLENQNFFQKRMTMIKHGFVKGKLIQNIGLFIRA